MNEDPVTGSTHCMIAPYWSRRLNKSHITAFQSSARTGILYCECVGDKVIISGKAVLFSINDIVALGYIGAAFMAALYYKKQSIV